jgi:hypothetical protein
VTEDIFTPLDGMFEEMEVCFRDGKFYFEVGNPWAGDTETGFGYTCHASLDSEKAKELAEWLLSKLSGDAA